MTSREKLQHALVTIEAEMEERVAELEGQGKLLEAERLRQRTTFDLEMLRETGGCAGIENYSRHLSGARAGKPALVPARLLPRRLFDVRRRVPHDAAPGPWHVPRRPSRKEVLIDYGFRLRRRSTTGR